MDNIKNTPSYLKKARYELLARLENLGPFSFFWTLSCVDLRWPENFSALLEDVCVGIDEDGAVTINGRSLDEYFSANENKYDFVKNNLLNATLTFVQRVKMFIKHILMSAQNPLCVQYYGYRVDFAMRGAGHIHGVLWINWDKINALPYQSIEKIKSALQKIKNEEVMNNDEKQALADFADKFISCSLKNSKTEKIVRKVNIHCHTKACRKNSKECRFNFPRFPTLKTIVAVPIRFLEEDPEKQKVKLKHAKAVREKVLKVLQNEEQMKEIQKIKSEEMKCLLQSDKPSEKEMLQYKSERLIRLLNCAGLSAASDDELVKYYENALAISDVGYRIIHSRDVDETFVNNYNPEWIVAWNANMDFQFCFDYFAIITYISDYYSKDDSGTVQFIRDALNHSDNADLKSRLKIVAQTFVTHRQIGECEAFFRILPHLNMKYSNIESIFVPTGFRENRSKFLKQLTEEEVLNFPNVCKIEGREGYLIEKPSMLDKYERMNRSKNPALNQLSYIQFSKRYSTSKVMPKPEELSSEVIEKPSNLSSSQMNEYILTHDFQIQQELIKLPKMIELLNVVPGEPKFMRLRSLRVARLHKFNQLKHPHEFYYSELQLYRPFQKESELEPDSYESCKSIYDETSEHNGQKKVTNVKRLIMEHLESMEEGTERAQELIDSIVEDVLDSTFAQENIDCAEVGVSGNSEIPGLDPVNITADDNLKASTFRRIELYDDDKLKSLTQNLDYDQRLVLDKAADYAIQLVKCRKVKIQNLKAPLLVIQGGAGSGKSTVIDVVSQHVEKILRKPGDNPDHPYILKAAYTGTAAANIRGQTLHSALSFNFGSSYLSLNDKARDDKRNTLENLMFVIIDEFSFIDADMLYKLDLRLKEIKQQPFLDFGGVAVILLGDILQLKPVRARYICEEPKEEGFKLRYLVDPLWQKFDVIILKKNHRQGEDQLFANILNRMRLGKLTDEDKEQLCDRIRPASHPDLPRDALIVTCTNKVVNQINEEMLHNLEGELLEFHALNKSDRLREVKPLLDNTGAIRNTPLQKTLCLKVGAKVMLTYNIDTPDCLTNGAFGEILGFTYGKNGVVSQVVVHFQDDECGKNKRKSCEWLTKKYGKNATPIERIEFHYSLSKKQNTRAKTAAAIQFPLRLAFAATAHKVQGLTVKKPNKLIADIRSVREPAQAYVIMSRVQSLSQLFILESLSIDKIYSSDVALEEHERLNRISLKSQDSLQQCLISCNIRSLKKHFSDLASSSYIENADIICLQETWLEKKQKDNQTEELKEKNRFRIHGYDAFFNNAGRGKGTSVYLKRGHECAHMIAHETYQIMVVNYSMLDIINVYRSSASNSISFLKDLMDVFNSNKNTLIVGDLNVCCVTEKHHPILCKLFEVGFVQGVQYPSHIEGRTIDYVLSYFPKKQKIVKVHQFGQYFTDHDLLMADISSFTDTPEEVS